MLDGVELFRAHAIESFDTAVAKLHTADGVKLWFGVSHVSGDTLEPEIFIHGSNGTAGWRYESETWLVDVNGRRQQHSMPSIAETRQSMMAAVLRRLWDPQSTICGVDMARRHTEVIEAIHRAGPIKSFPPEMVQWKSGDGAGAEIPVVVGLTAAMQRAFAAQELLTRCDFDPGLQEVAG